MEAELIGIDWQCRNPEGDAAPFQKDTLPTPSSYPEFESALGTNSAAHAELEKTTGRTRLRVTTSQARQRERHLLTK